jgi:hypothetical protein
MFEAGYLFIPYIVLTVISCSFAAYLSCRETRKFKKIILVSQIKWIVRIKQTRYMSSFRARSQVHVLNILNYYLGEMGKIKSPQLSLGLASEYEIKYNIGKGLPFLMTYATFIEAHLFFSLIKCRQGHCHV